MSHKPQGVRNISSKGKSPRVRRGSLALSKEVHHQVINAVDTDAVYEDVQFKEQELKRRVDLKAITSHETLSSMQRGGAPLRGNTYNNYSGQSPLKTPRSTGEAIAWADFEETEKNVKEQPWYEKVRMYAAGVTEAETTIVRESPWRTARSRSRLVSMYSAFWAHPILLWLFWTACTALLYITTRYCFSSSYFPLSPPPPPPSHPTRRKRGHAKRNATHAHVGDRGKGLGQASCR